MYVVHHREKKAPFETRVQAVEYARQLSAEARGEVRVEDDKGREQLRYQDGQLQTYRYG